MDNYAIDYHKLMYHPRRVTAWLNGEPTAPIYVEISPIGACQHRCRFCALDFMGYKRRKLELGLLEATFGEMVAIGVKSVMFAGEGEPLLHRDIAEIVRTASLSGLDVAITTNGGLLKPELAEKILPYCHWIKTSIDAGFPKTYAVLHGVKYNKFYQALHNMERAASIKERNKYSCVLGFQMLWLPENRNEVFELAKLAKDTGMDYLVVKPYSQHPSSDAPYGDIDYSGWTERVELNGFPIIYRTDTMNGKERIYDKCYALPFWAYIDSGGGVWSCSAHLNDKKFYYGNIKRQPFGEMVWVENKPTPDCANCRGMCRMDACNRYLWALKEEPPEHINFI